jgi:hypothetical protein
MVAVIAIPILMTLAVFAACLMERRGFVPPTDGRRNRAA